MKISELIEKLNSIQNEHGDLEVFCQSKYSPYDFLLTVSVAHDYPPDWDMPDGFKYLSFSPLD